MSARLRKSWVLPCYGIQVSISTNDDVDGWGPSGSAVANDLLRHEDETQWTSPHDFFTEEYIGAVHAIEGMILGHAMAGIDISKPAYIEGIEYVVEKIEAVRWP